MNEQQLTFGYGLCACGCGGKTSIVQTSSRARGRVKGEPSRFLVGHASRSSGHEYEERQCGYETPCWVWMLAINRQGYGQVSGSRSRSGSRLAHVAYWTRIHGPVPPGLELDHLCRTTACVNPAHLEPVTHIENIRRGAQTRLTADNVREIRDSHESPLELAARFGVARRTIYGVLGRDTWKDVA